MKGISKLIVIDIAQHIKSIKENLHIKTAYIKNSFGIELNPNKMTKSVAWLNCKRNSLKSKWTDLLQRYIELLRKEL